MSDGFELLAAFWPQAPSPSERYVLLDVFARAPLQGNQLAVFPDGRGLSAPAMQALAAGEVTLETGAGPVAVTVTQVGTERFAGSMSQPVPVPEPFPAAAELLAALGVERSVLPVEAYANGPRHVYVTLPGEPDVAALAPDRRALLDCAGQAGVSCFAGSGSRYKTRMFAPGLGVDEDPATGSAAGPLAVHLLRHGRIGFGQEIEIAQGEELGRPSLLRARVEGASGGIEAVHVAGDALLVGRGELHRG